MNQHNSGLVNIGNTCFMNSVIQVLSSTPSLSDYFIHDIYQTDINLVNPLGSKGEIVTAFSKLIKELREGKNSAVVPQLFKKIFSKYNPMYCGYNQHDAAEFLLQLLDSFNEDINQVKYKPYVEITKSNEREDLVVALEHWDAHIQRNQSFIVDLFQAQYKSRIECPFCKNVSITFDPYMTVQIPVASIQQDQAMPYQDENNNQLTLYDCLSFFQQQQELDEDNPWYCSQCKMHVRGIKQMQLYSTPQILIIHLKRFNHIGKQIKDKNNTFIRYPLTLDLTKYVINKEIPNNYLGDPKTAQLKYKLYGIVNHFGDMEGGHYNSIVKNISQNKWFLYDDDEQVKEVKHPQEILQQNAYILFYQRMD